MSQCTTYRVEVDGCVDGVKTVAVELYAGLPGATGPSGMPSTIPGPSGAAGPSGPQGIQGIPGESIVGATGPRGLQGERGEQGVSGIPGEPGERGSTGPSGARGEQGEVGATGSSGIQGIQGVSGQPGAVGATGSTGPASTVPGATGATGPIPSSAVIATQISRFTGDGSTSVFSPLTGFQSGDNGARYLVQLDGVEQDPDPTNGAFVIASNQITFAGAVPSGVNIVVRRLTVSLS